MQYLRLAIVFLVASLGAHQLVELQDSLTAQEPKQQPKVDPLLGFDMDKVPTADPAKGPPLARIFYDYVYLDDLKVEAAKLDKQSAPKLGGTIYGTLQDKYIKHHKFTASPREIEDLLGEPAPADVSEEYADRRFIAEQYVVQWKFDRALYEKYGGIVIFQQGNPREPVGAYRQFLEEMEKARVFEIFDPTNREMALHYFTRKHPFEVPPKDVSFDEPWWMQKWTEE